MHSLRVDRLPVALCALSLVAGCGSKPAQPDPHTDADALAARYAPARLAEAYFEVRQASGVVQPEWQEVFREPHPWFPCKHKKCPEAAPDPIVDQLAERLGFCCATLLREWIADHEPLLRRLHELPKPAGALPVPPGPLKNLWSRIPPFGISQYCRLALAWAATANDMDTLLSRLQVCENIQAILLAGKSDGEFATAAWAEKLKWDLLLTLRFSGRFDVELTERVPRLLEDEVVAECFYVGVRAELLTSYQVPERGLPGAPVATDMLSLVAADADCTRIALWLATGRPGVKDVSAVRDELMNWAALADVSVTPFLTLRSIAYVRDVYRLAADESFDPVRLAALDLDIIEPYYNEAEDAAMGRIHDQVFYILPPKDFLQSHKPLSVW